MLRKSRSSFDLNFNFVGNQLGSVKELDDEDDLTIPYEPEEPAEVEKMTPDHELPEEPVEVEKTTPDHELAVGISFELTEEDSVEDGSMDELKVLVERDSSPELKPILTKKRSMKDIANQIVKAKMRAEDRDNRARKFER